MWFYNATDSCMTWAMVMSMKGPVYFKCAVVIESDADRLSMVRNIQVISNGRRSAVQRRRKAMRFEIHFNGKSWRREKSMSIPADHDEPFSCSAVDGIVDPSWRQPVNTREMPSGTSRLQSVQNVCTRSSSGDSPAVGATQVFRVAQRSHVVLVRVEAGIQRIANVWRTSTSNRKPVRTAACRPVCRGFIWFSF